MDVALDALGIVVSDLNRALAFYRTLGIPVGAVADGEDHVEFALPSGLRLMWDTEALIRSFDPDFAPAAGASRIALAFRCESPEAVDAVCGRIAEAGYPIHKAPWDAFWGQRYAQVRDPDGNPIDLFANLPEGD